MRGKPVWSKVTLRIRWEGGAGPAAIGDHIVTKTTGKRYEVLEIRGKQHFCRVVPEDTQLPAGNREWVLTWDDRRRKR